MISIIIPVYNAAPYLRECLDSCFGQTYCAIEVVAVNDGSKDQSGAILDEYAKSEPRLKVIHQDNLGVVAARNKGVQNCVGRWIMFLDSDDLLTSNAVALMFDQAVRTDADLVTASLELLWSDGSTRIIEQPSGQFSGQQYFEMLLSSELIWGPYCKLFKRNLFDSTIEIPSDIRIGEDFMTNMIIATRVNSVACINVSVYFYRKLGSSTVYTYQYGTDYWLKFIDILSKKLKLEGVALSDTPKAFYKFKLNVSFTIITSGIFISDPAWINCVGKLKDVKLTKKELITLCILPIPRLQWLFFFFYKKIFLRKL